MATAIFFGCLMIASAIDKTAEMSDDGLKVMVALFFAFVIYDLAKLSK